ncbi:MAG: hypothetical protein R3C61_26225 [Bacteroidia bacterium]
MAQQCTTLLVCCLLTSNVFSQPGTHRASDEKTSQSRQVIFEELFDDNNRNWEIIDSKQLSSEISDGYFQLKGKTAYSPAFLSQSIDLDPTGNFSFQSTIIQSSGMKNMGYGICWGAKDDRQDWYAFLISSNGQYTILKKVREDYTEIKRWTSSDNINGQGKPNTLLVKKNNDRIEYYINDRLVYMSQAEPFRGKKAGILFHGTMKIEVDNFIAAMEP